MLGRMVVAVVVAGMWGELCLLGRMVAVVVAGMRDEPVLGRAAAVETLA